MARKLIPFFHSPRKLAAQIQGTTLSLLLFERSQVLKYETFLLHESSKEVMAKKVKAFLGGQKLSASFLIMNRAEILQKEFLLPDPGEDFKRSLEANLAKLLPYAPREMAYGMSVTENGSAKALIYAVPEKPVREHLETFKEMGLPINDIVSEDQCLAWLIQKKHNPAPVIIVDAAQDRFLFVLLHENRIIFSRQYPRLGESLEDIAAELSMPLLESGLQVSKIILSGLLEPEKVELQRLLKAPEEILYPDPKQPAAVPAVMLGALYWQEYPEVSLLPHDLKAEKRTVMRKKSLRNAAAAWALFLGSTTLACALHLGALNHKASKLEKEAAELSAQVTQIKEMDLALKRIDSAVYSKKRLLDLIKELAEQIPPSVRLRSLDAGEHEIVFEAEGMAHSLITETVQAFENNPLLRDVKLEHTRFRKRLNQDSFEFELSAKWRSA